MAIKNKNHINLKIDDEDFQILQDIIKQDKESMSEVLRKALRAYFKSRQ